MILTAIVPENYSQKLTDGFILELIWVLIILAILFICIKKRKVIYSYFVKKESYNYNDFRLFSGLILLIIISIGFVFKFFSRIFS
jgi:beta-lactamase regulating signal transducer with metallopeptidase domain